VKEFAGAPCLQGAPAGGCSKPESLYRVLLIKHGHIHCHEAYDYHNGKQDAEYLSCAMAVPFFIENAEHM